MRSSASIATGPVTRRLVVAILAVLLFPVSGYAFVELLVGGVVTYLAGKGLVDEAKGAVRETIADIDRRVKERIDQAGDRADGSIRLAGEELRKNLKEAERILNEAIDKAANKADDLRKKVFDDLARERKQFFADLERQQRSFFDRAEVLLDGVLQREEAIIQRALTATIDEVELLRADLANLTATPFAPKVHQVQRVRGQAQVYQLRGEYRFALVGPGVGSGYAVSVHLNKRAVGKDQQTERLHLREFEVPAGDISPLFKDTERAVLPLWIESKELKKAETKVVLLPKFPAEYKLTFYLPEGEKQAGFVPFPVGDFAKAEEDMVRKQHGDGAEEDKAVREREGRLLALTRSRLQFGPNQVDLPPKATSFMLEVRWFNGDHVILSRSHKSDGGVTATWDEGTGKLRIDVGRAVRGAER